MAETRKYLALIAEHKHQIVDWLRQYQRDHGMGSVRYNSSTEQGFIRLHNVTTPYLMVYDNRTERLRGAELMGYETIGHVNPNIAVMAMSRVRCSWTKVLTDLSGNGNDAREA